MEQPLKIIKDFLDRHIAPEVINDYPDMAFDLLQEIDLEKLNADLSAVKASHRELRDEVSELAGKLHDANNRICALQLMGELSLNHIADEDFKKKMRDALYSKEGTPETSAARGDQNNTSQIHEAKMEDLLRTFLRMEYGYCPHGTELSAKVEEVLEDNTPGPGATSGDQNKKFKMEKEEPGATLYAVAPELRKTCREAMTWLDQFSNGEFVWEETPAADVATDLRNAIHIIDRATT